MLKIQGRLCPFFSKNSKKIISLYCNLKVAFLAIMPCSVVGDVTFWYQSPGFRLPGLIMMKVILTIVN